MSQVSEREAVGIDRDEVGGTSRLLLAALAVLTVFGLVAAAIVTLFTGAEPITAQFPAYGPGTVDPEACAASPGDCQVTLFEDPVTGAPAYPREAYSQDQPLSFLYECSSKPTDMVMSIIHGFRADPGADPRTGQFDNVADVAWTTEPSTLPIADGRYGQCIAVPTVLNLPETEMAFFTENEGSTEHTLWFSFDRAADQRAQVDFLVLDEVVERTVPLEEALNALRITPPQPERSLSLAQIWVPTLGLLTLIATVGLIVARPLLAIARRAETSATEAERGQREAMRQRNQANRILNATHHELGREIALVGFATDDLTDDGADTAELLASFSRLEAGRDTVAALAQLSAGNLALGHQTVAAVDLVETDPPVPVRSKGTETLVEVDRLLMRTLVKHIVRLAGLAEASEVCVEIDSGDLVLGLPDASVSAEALRSSWESDGLDESSIGELLAVVHSVSEAHNARATFADSSNAVEIRISFDGQSLDLRASDSAESKIVDRHQHSAAPS